MLENFKKIWIIPAALTFLLVWTLVTVKLVGHQAAKEAISVLNGNYSPYGPPPPAGSVK